jgi:thiamine-phosphate pyrophosphorylase
VDSQRSSPTSRADISGARLYAILDLGYVEVADASRVTKALLEGGAGVLQLRGKGKSQEVIEAVARELIPLCRAAGVPFVLNDYPALAARLGADGVHIGQDDGSLEAARKQVGPNLLIGRSTHSLEQAEGALKEGFDYIGFGPLFPTPTKLGRPGIGLENIKAMESRVGSSIPAFCIGGIKRENLREVMSAGAKRVVIVSDLLTAEDVASATREVIGQL